MNSGSKYIYADFISEPKSEPEMPNWVKWLFVLQGFQLVLLAAFFWEVIS